MNSNLKMVLGFAAGIVALVYTIMSGSVSLAPSVLVYLLGVSCNSLVMLVNGNRFPVVLDKDDIGKWIEDGPEYFVADSDTKLAWLGDRFKIFRIFRFSIGDVLLEVGVGSFVLIALLAS